MERSLYYKDIILKHGKSCVASRSECDITQKLGNHTFTTPVVMSNMKSIQTKEICKMFDNRGWFYVYQRIDGAVDIYNFIKNSQDFNVVSISIGVKQEDLELLRQVYGQKLRIDYITIDVALSYNDIVIPIIQEVKKLFPDAFLIVGNGDSPDWIEWLIQLGVDGAKMNIGTSNSCRTRQFTGFSSTTVTDLMKCRTVAYNRIKLISDGGLTVAPNGEVWIGDVAKAIRFGADFVMSGSLFSRAIDCPAVVNGYFGNSTELAKGHSNHIEGTNVNVKTTGLTIVQTMKLIEDSLKSSVSYSGFDKLDGLRYVGWEVIN
jgi:GMP reductase